MPYKQARDCRIPGCPDKAEQGTQYCIQHKQQQIKQYDRDRDKELKRKYNRKDWRNLRAHKIAAQPLCEKHLQRGEVVAAVFVHHKQEVAGGADIITTLDRLESVCRSCHEKQHTKGFIKRNKRIDIPI